MALPVVDTNEPGVKELIQGSVKEIANTIFAAANVSITAAAKAVTPSIPEMVGDITEDLRAGPINRFSQGLEKLDKLLQNFGGDIKEYSAELGKFVDQREARINKSETTIKELRENNVKAEITNMGEINILSKFQIALKEKELAAANEVIKKEIKNVEEKTKLVQEENGNTKARRESIVKSQNTIIEKEKERTQLLETLNKTEEEDKRGFFERLGDGIKEYVPEGLSDVGSAFTEGLMTPINAVKDLGIMFGSILKFAKNLPKLLKGFAAGLMASLVAMLPYLAIAAAIVIGLIALKKGFDLVVDNLDVIKQKLSDFGDAVMAIPGKISDFFTSVFAKIKNFFIDAINGVIGLINKIPGVEIEKIEKAPEGIDNSSVGDQDAAFAAGNLDQRTTDVESNESGLVLPPTAGDEGGGFFSKFKNFFKSKPANNEYMPVDTSSATSGNAIIDNSVKTVNQNNQNQNLGISTRNDDVTLFRTSDMSA